MLQTDSSFWWAWSGHCGILDQHILLEVIRLICKLDNHFTDHCKLLDEVKSILPSLELRYLDQPRGSNFNAGKMDQT